MPRTFRSCCHRQAIGQTEPSMIATAPRKYHTFACARMCSVWEMLIFQTMYAVQPPVMTRVPRRRRSFFWRLDSFCMGRPEAYALGRQGRPLQSLGGAAAGREHRAGPVGVAVDAHPLDAWKRFGLRQPVRRARAVEEAHAGPAGATLRP